MASPPWYAQLGGYTFDQIPVTGISEKYAYDYPEHAVIEGKPVLQFIGDKLNEMTLGVRFHFSFCNPKDQFDMLKAEADGHKPLDLNFQDGTYAGKYVITGIDKTLVITADNGVPLCIEAQLNLKEWVDGDPQATATAAQQADAPGLAGLGPVSSAPQAGYPATGNAADDAKLITRSA